MADMARQRLHYIVECYGDEILNDRAKTEDLIRKLCGEDQRRIELLVGALNTGFVPDLIGWRGRGDPSRFLPRVARALEQQLGATPDEALWTAGSWAVALGLLDEASAERLAAMEPPPVPPKAPGKAPLLQPPQKSGLGAHMGLVVRIASLSLVLLCLLWPAHCVSQFVKKHPPPPSTSAPPLDPKAEKVIFTPLTGWKVSTNLRFLQFADGGRRLLAVEDSYSLRSWDSETGALLDTYRDGYGSILGISPDGKKAALVNSGGPGVVIADVAARATSGPLDWGDGGYTRCYFSPDNRFLLCGHGKGNLLTLWDLTFMRPFLEGPSFQEGADEPPLAFSPDGTTIAVAEPEGGAPATYAFGATAFTLLRRFEGHGAPASLICFNADGSRLATGAWDSTVRIWGTTTGNAIGRINLRGHPIRALFHPALPIVLTIDEKGDLSAWDERDGTEIGRLADPVLSMAVSPDGKLLATFGGWDGRRVNLDATSIKVYNLDAGLFK
jgi:hypothetical protein